MSEQSADDTERGCPVEDVLSMHAKAAEEIEVGEWETHHEAMPEGYYDE